MYWAAVVSRSAALTNLRTETGKPGHSYKFRFDPMTRRIGATRNPLRIQASAVVIDILRVVGNLV
jgi:hypothetical protein